MSLINEKEIMRKWAEETASDGIKTCLAHNVSETYWHKREKVSGIEEYGFETIPELRAQLEHLWADEPEMQEKVLNMAVAAFKTRKECEDKEAILPVYVYAF